MTPSRPRAEEWAVVLAALDIPYTLREDADGWALVVPAGATSAALDALAAYERENAAEPPSPRDAAPTARPLTLSGVYLALLLLGMFAISGPRAAASEWFERGSADAARIVAGEWWRAVTALTLHADAEHVLGNAVAGAILVSAVCQPLGPGIGLWLLLLSGAIGNALAAAAYRSAHVSVGASTAIFGAIGILAALRVLEPAGGRVGGRKRWVALAAAVALLVTFGTGPNVDLLGHLFGLLAGGALGSLGVFLTRRAVPTWVQALLVVAAAAAVAGAWRAAF